MSKVKVPVWGTVNKTIFFDPDAGARAEAAVEALAQAISEGIGGAISHSSLQGLQLGDDHPQYTMWQAAETIQGQWNFATIPYIQGDTLAEYIEDVVGSSTFDFLQDTSSVVWTYHETANELEANVPPEFVQDTVGNMVADSTTIDFTYSDLAGTLTAAVIQSFGYSWSASHTWSDNSEVRLGTGNDLRLYHDGTNSFVRNDNGHLNFNLGASTALQIPSSGSIVNVWPGVTGGSGLAVDASNGNTADFRMMQAGVNMWIFRKTGDSNTGSNAGSNFAIVARDDTGASLGNCMIMTRATGAVSWGLGASGHHSWANDNQEIRLGASNDLRLYHDGTDSWVRNDTGILKLSIGANPALQFNSSRAFGVNGANYGTTGQVLTSQGSGAPPQWSNAGTVVYTLVQTVTVAGAAATNIDISSLDLATDGCYILRLILDNATASNITVSAFYNSDTTATNYDRAISTDGGTATAFNNANVAQVVASSTSVYEITISPDFDGRPRALISGSSGNTTALAGQIGTMLWRTASNVTAIRINSSVASGFSIGSKVNVYKRTA